MVYMDTSPPVRPAIPDAARTAAVAALRPWMGDRVFGMPPTPEFVAPQVLEAAAPHIVAAELDALAREMDERPTHLSVTAEDVRARAALLRGEDTWCNCQAIRGTANYPGPWHPKGDPIGCLKWGGASQSTG